MYRSIIEAVLENGIRNPKKLAIADSEESYTYEGSIVLVKRAAYVLQKEGVRYDDKIIVECSQDARFLILAMACQYMGAIFVPIEKAATLLRAQEIYFETNARCIIGLSNYSSVGRFYDLEIMWSSILSESNEQVECKQNDISEILFSTGTTGNPKGIIIPNEANIAIAQNICNGVGMTSDTVELVPLPLSHSHGLRTCYANLYNGSSSVIIDGVMNVKQFFEMIDKYNINALDISPTLATLLLKIARKGLNSIADTIKYIELGTAALDDNTKEKLREIFKHSKLYNFYGATEAGRSCVLDFNEFDKTGCIGYPTQNANLFIVDDDKNIIKSSRDNIGLIAVSGGMLMKGYLNDITMTEETVVDGVLYTSDMGYLDEMGRVYVIGRQGDIINYKGIKIAPEEIENVVRDFDGIKDCACIPEDDAICGQVPKLFIEIDNRETFDETSLNEYMRMNIEANRMPTSIHIIDTIPRSSNGKLLRRKLKNE